jgi:hypothetical protein
MRLFTENAVIPKKATEITRLDLQGTVDLHVTNLGESNIIISFKRSSDYRNVLSSVDIKVIGNKHGDKLSGPIAPGSLAIRLPKTIAEDRVLDTRLFLKRRAYGHSRDSQIGFVNYMTGGFDLNEDVRECKTVLKSVKCNFHRMNNESFFVKIGEKEPQEIYLFEEKSLFEVSETINDQLQYAESFVNSHGIDFSSDSSIELFDVPKVVTKKIGIQNKKVTILGPTISYVRTKLIKPRSKCRYIIRCRPVDQLIVFAISDKGSSRIRLES